MLVTYGVNARLGIRRILFGVYALNWIMKPNPSDSFIIYCYTPYVWKRLYKNTKKSFSFVLWNLLSNWVMDCKSCQVL